MQSKTSLLRDLHITGTQQSPYTVNLTCLDMVFPSNGLATGLAIYREIPDIERLEAAIAGAVDLFPTFAGRVGEQEPPAIAVGKSGLKLELYETSESLLQDIPPSHDRLLNLLGFMARDSSLMRERVTFAMMLLINRAENSAALTWKSAHCHTDGATINKFLRTVADLYNDRPPTEKEELDRNSELAKVTRGVEARFNNYLFSREKDVPTERPFEQTRPEKFSSTLCINEGMLDAIKEGNLSERRLIYAVALKTHALCFEHENFSLETIIDIRNKKIVSDRFSGNALLSERCELNSQFLRVAPFSSIYENVKKNTVWNAQHAGEAIAYLEQTKAQKKLFLLDERSELIPNTAAGRTLNINDLTFYRFDAVDLAGKPIWYDTAVSPANCMIIFQPQCLDENNRYIRIFGPKSYVNHFISIFPATLTQELRAQQAAQR